MEEELLKRKKNNKKKIILGSIIGVLVGTLLSVSYAFFTFNNTGMNNKLIVGDIYMRYKESSNTINFQDAMPSTTYDSSQKFEFTIEGKNTTTNKDIWYEIVIKRGDIPNGKTEQNRIPDRFIKYKLVEQIDNGQEVIVVDGDSWEGLNLGKTIYVDKINKNQTTDTEHKYTLYMWISNKLVIGNDANADFTIANWNNAFASIKVDVNGDFTEKAVDEEYNTVNAMNTFPTVITDQKANIKEVYFNKMNETDMNTRYNAATIKADLTYNNEGKVLAWLETNTQDNTKYNLIIASDGKTYLTTGYTLFKEFSSVNKFEFNNIDTSRVVNMAAMFNSCTSLQNIDLRFFDTSNVSSMQAMFHSCTNLQSVDLHGLDTSHVTDMEAMFHNCTSMENIDLSYLNTSSIQTMSMIFGNCSNLKHINMSNLGGNSLAYLGGFASGTNLVTLNMNNFNFGQVSDISGAFNFTKTDITEINLSNSKMPNVTMINMLFYNCPNLTTLNLSGSDMSSVTQMHMAFQNSPKLKELDLSGIDSSKITGASQAFYNCTSLQKVYVSSTWNLANLPVYPLFSGNTALVGGNGTHYADGNANDKTYAIIDGTNGEPGYFTDIADKPNN